jgi:hypothetical protein
MGNLRYGSVSQRTTVAADNSVAIKNIGVGSPVTSLKGTLAVTVTGSPQPAELGGARVTVVVAPPTVRLTCWQE